jgi:hypothetical protein
MQPALWVMERLLGIKAPVSCAAHRGTAVETGVTLGLLNPDVPIDACRRGALLRFDELAAFSGDPRKQKHREEVPGMVENALLELRQYGLPDRVQERVVRELPGVPIPLLGFIDFGWSQHGIQGELKTSGKLPTQINGSHARQLAAYVHNTNYEGRICYVTPKRIAVYALDDVEKRFMELREIAVRLGRFLSLSRDPHELASLLVPDPDHWLWSNPFATATRIQVYGL